MTVFKISVILRVYKYILYMTKNPFYNALAAGAYIVIIVNVIFFGTRLLPQGANETIFIPMGMLSLFTLSAAVMGYIFLYEPILYLIEGKKREALKLFLKTVGSFGVITAVFLLLAFLMR